MHLRLFARSSLHTLLPAVPRARCAIARNNRVPTRVVPALRKLSAVGIVTPRYQDSGPHVAETTAPSSEESPPEPLATGNLRPALFSITILATTLLSITILEFIILGFINIFCNRAKYNQSQQPKVCQ